MKNLLKKFVSGAAFCAGIFGFALVVPQIEAATIPYASTAGLASDPITMINALI
jgi:hypothetical protein